MSDIESETTPLMDHHDSPLGACGMKYPEAVDIAQITPNLFISRVDSKVHLFCAPGGGCSQSIMSFDSDPTPDPLSYEDEALLDLDMDEFDALSPEVHDALDLALVPSMAWEKVARKAMEPLTADVLRRDNVISKAWYFVEDLREAGYDPLTGDGSVERWLYNLIGETLAGTVPGRTMLFFIYYMINTDPQEPEWEGVGIFQSEAAAQAYIDLNRIPNAYISAVDSKEYESSAAKGAYATTLDPDAATALRATRSHI
jgi:hypothetical protein